MFSVATLTDDEALLIAEAYFKGEKDPPKMAKLLGIDQFDLNVLMHPLVRRHTTRIQREMEVTYSLKEHAAQLRKIRDAAFDDEEWKAALSAEVQLGKASGLYEPKLPGDGLGEGKAVDAKKLGTEELRQRLAHLIGAVVPTADTSLKLLDVTPRDDDEESDEV